MKKDEVEDIHEEEVRKFLLPHGQDGEEVGGRVARDGEDGLGSFDSPEKDRTGRSEDQKKVHDRLGFQRKKKKKKLFCLEDKKRAPC